MEIKPGRIALTFSEARWAEHECAFVSPDLRTKIEQSRRQVLVPFLTANFFDGVPLLTENLSEHSGERFEIMERQLDAMEEMKTAENEYAASPDAVVHPVEVDVNNAEVEGLYDAAVVRNEEAGIVMTDPDPAARLGAILEAELGGDEAVREVLARDGLSFSSLYEVGMGDTAENMEIMAVTTGIIRAVDLHRQQLT